MNEAEYHANFALTPIEVAALLRAAGAPRDQIQPGIYGLLLGAWRSHKGWRYRCPDCGGCWMNAGGMTRHLGSATLHQIARDEAAEFLEAARDAALRVTER